MKASRLKPENHWRGVGAAIGKQGGSPADLDRVKSGRSVIDNWITEGYAKAFAKRTRPSKK